MAGAIVTPPAMPPDRSRRGVRRRIRQRRRARAAGPTALLGRWPPCIRCARPPGRGEDRERRQQALNRVPARGAAVSPTTRAVVTAMRQECPSAARPARSKSRAGPAQSHRQFPARSASPAADPRRQLRHCSTSGDVNPAEPNTMPAASAAVRRPGHRRCRSRLAPRRRSETPRQPRRKAGAVIDARKKAIARTSAEPTAAPMASPHRRPAQLAARMRTG